MAEGEVDKAPAVLLVPCPETERIGCRIVRRAVELVAASEPEMGVSSPQDCPRRAGAFVVAVDGSSQCQACAVLRSCGVRPGAVVSAPAVLAKTGLLRPGADLHAKEEVLVQALADAIRAALQAVLQQLGERNRYRADISPVIQRFDGIWSKIEALPSPDGAGTDEERSRVELLGRRARNIFVKLDEFVPPTEWAEPHDLFQDAMLCLAYATEGWAARDADRWEQNMEKARVQINPLLRRLRP